MEFEIFRDVSLNKIIADIDNLEEWKKLCEEVGMTAQYELQGGKDKSPIPYPFVNTHYQRIIDALCPSHVEIEKYSKTTVPLEVLREIKLCRVEQYFNSMEIYYDDKSPDPFVIGCKGHWNLYKSGYIKGEDGAEMKFDTREQAMNIADSLHPGATPYFTMKERYLVAKFGEHNKTWEELKKLSITRTVEKFAGDLKVKIKDLQDALARIEDNTARYINGEINESQLKGGYW